MLAEITNAMESGLGHGRPAGLARDVTAPISVGPKLHAPGPVKTRSRPKQ